MFQRIRDWWTGWWVAMRVGRVRKQLVRIDVGFAKASERMEAMQAELTKEIEVQQRFLKRSEEILETSQGKLRVAEETIKALVASNKVLTERWDAEAAIQVQRRVGAIQTEPIE